MTTKSDELYWILNHPKDVFSLGEVMMMDANDLHDVRQSVNRLENYGDTQSESQHRQ
jgi:hypothetical protein